MGNISLYNCDCREIYDSLPADASIVSDPPYGCRNQCNYRRFSGGAPQCNKDFPPIINDNQPFNPIPWLSFPKVVLFGYQFFASSLPQGTVYVWLKKRDNQLGTFLSDAELIWAKGGKGCYVHRHIWNGFDRQSEKGEKTVHPTQKPVALMEWILGKAKITGLVVDPYCGSGSTALACQRLGLPFIGCEIDPHYFDVACKRLKEKV